MNLNITHTSSSLLEALRKKGHKLSRQRLEQLRNGYSAHYASRDGDEVYYIYKPILEQGKDWVYHKGRVVYNDTAMNRVLHNK